MDKRSQQIFSENSTFILEQAARRYGIAVSQFRRLGSFESFVYEFERGGRDFVMKLTHSLHRTVDAIRGELDWTNYLADGGVAVPRAIASERGRLVEVVTLPDSFFAVYAFEKAGGRPARFEDWDDDFVRRWGRLLGQMHRLTRMYQPPDEAIRRHEWSDEISRHVEKYVPVSQAAVIDKCHRLQERLRQLPQDVDSYGLIHSDLHHSNFFVDDGELIALDFDDCHYDWFANDIAMPLFYALRDSQVDADNKVFATGFMRHLLEGYRQENAIGGFWLEQIPVFLKLREMELYIIIHAEDAHNLNGWCRRFMEDRRDRIENDVPIIDLDFTQFADDAGH
ncbi:MAG: phosphotransferase [candidate division Zixibacteria bacterium]|nr:phosphotransferase [candidate division Zixibacteria bacterium]